MQQQYGGGDDSDSGIGDNSLVVMVMAAISSITKVLCGHCYNLLLFCTEKLMVK